MLVYLILGVLRQLVLSTNVVCVLPPERARMMSLINANGVDDVCVARGGKYLLYHAQDNSWVPFIETGAGVVHVDNDKMDGL